MLQKHHNRSRNNNTNITKIYEDTNRYSDYVQIDYYTIQFNYDNAEIKRHAANNGEQN